MTIAIRKRRSVIQQGLDLLRKLGDRADVFVAGVASTQTIDMPNGTFFVPGGYDNTLTLANGGFYTNTGTAGQTRACMTMSCIVGQKYTLSFTNAASIPISIFIREGVDGFGTIISSISAPVGAASITWTATNANMVVLWNFNPPQPITITNVKLQNIRSLPYVQDASISPTGVVQSVGPELIPNGDFSNGTTGWILYQPTTGIVQAESGGVRIRTTDTTFAAIQAPLLLGLGLTYRITFTIKSWVAGRVQLSVDGSTPAYNSLTANGTYSVDVVASGACVVQIKRYGGENCDLIIDDVSCKLITNSPTSVWLMDYVDSSAVTPASVDGPVGFLSDGTGIIGPELAPQSLLNWTYYNTPVSVTDTSVTADAVADGLFFTGLVVGQQYQLNFAGTTTATITLQQYGGSTIYQTGFGTCIFVAQEARFLLRFGAVGTATFTKISVRAISGRNATQGTGANKPTLRKGLVNLQTYSNALTNAAWQKGNSTVTAGQVDPYGGTSAFLITATAGSNSYVNNPTSLATGGTTYTRAVIAKAGTTPFLFVEAGSNGSYFQSKFDLSTGIVTGGSYTSTSMRAIGGGYYLCLATWSTGASGAQTANALYLDNYGAASSNSNLTIYATAVFPGVVTADQILTCGIPITTGSSASSLVGNYKLSYTTGGTQALALQSAPFLVTEDHVIIQGITVADSGGTHASFAMATNLSRFPVLYVSAGGYPAVSWRDDTGVGVTVTTSQVSNGDSFVFTGRRVGSTGWARKNGVPYQVTITGLGTTTATSAYIGASTGGTINWAGDIYVTIIIRGTVSDAELLVLERFVGALTGPLGVKF